MAKASRSRGEQTAVGGEEQEEEKEQEELEEDVQDIQKDLDDIKNAMMFIQQKIAEMEKIPSSSEKPKS